MYGGEKIACHDLRRILRDPEYRSRLPPDKVHELADLTDFNMGRAVNYEEFVRIVSYSVNYQEFVRIVSSFAHRCVTFYLLQ